MHAFACEPFEHAFAHGGRRNGSRGQPLNLFGHGGLVGEKVATRRTRAEMGVRFFDGVRHRLRTGARPEQPPRGSTAHGLALPLRAMPTLAAVNRQPLAQFTPRPIQT
jgi:hypothetical protein